MARDDPQGIRWDCRPCLPLSRASDSCHGCSPSVPAADCSAADHSALFASRPCIIGYGSFAIQIWPKPGAVERGLEPVTPVDRQR